MNLDDFVISDFESKMLEIRKINLKYVDKPRDQFSTLHTVERRELLHVNIDSLFWDIKPEILEKSFKYIAHGIEIMFAAAKITG